MTSGDGTPRDTRLLPGLLLAAVICIAALALGIWAAIDGAAAVVLDRVFAGLVALGMAIRAAVSAAGAWQALRDRDWRGAVVPVLAVVVLLGLFLLALVYAFPQA